MARPGLEALYPGLDKYLVGVEYLKPLPKYGTEKPYLLALDIPLADEADRTNLEFEEVRLEAADSRRARRRISLESMGFELRTLPLELMERYFDSSRSDKRAEMEGVSVLLTDRFAAEKVIVYEHAYRKESTPVDEAKYTYSNRPTHSIVVRNPHADQSTTSGRKRIETFFSAAEQERYCNDKWRIRIVNFWKPRYSKVQRAPLLLCDRLSVSSDDIVPCDTVSQAYVGEVLMLSKSSTHRWFWFKDQDVNEALLFVSYDSQGLPNRAGCFHSSCHLLAPDLFVPAIQDSPRESMEVRALVITTADDDGGGEGP